MSRKRPFDENKFYSPLVQLKKEQKKNSALQKTSTLNNSDYLRYRICLQTVGKSGKDDTYKTEIQRDTARGSNPSLSA